MIPPKKDSEKPDSDNASTDSSQTGNQDGSAKGEKIPEMGGRGGLDPTRYGDWEIGGRCVDF